MDRIKQIINEELSIINRDKKQQIFDYESVQEDAWLEPRKAGQEFQRISFDFENDDTVAKKTFFANVMLRKNQPVKDEFNAEMRIAGGDWERGVIYFRIEFTHNYGLISNKYAKNPEFVWDLGDEDGNLRYSGHKYILIPPVEAGNKLEKYEGTSNKYDWHAYQNSELSKEEEKLTSITDADKKNCWKWLEELLNKLVEDRHEMLDGYANKKIKVDSEPPKDDK